MKDRKGYNKGGDKREGGLIIDLDQTQTISRNLCLSVVHAFPPNVSCYHRIYFSFFLNPSLIKIQVMMTTTWTTTTRMTTTTKDTMTVG